MNSFFLPSAFIEGLGGPEMMLIFFIILLLFGGQKLPELAKGLGKTMREFKKATSGVEEEFKRAMEDTPRSRRNQCQRLPLPPTPCRLSLRPHPHSTLPDSEATEPAPGVKDERAPAEGIGPSTAVKPEEKSKVHGDQAPGANTDLAVVRGLRKPTGGQRDGRGFRDSAVALQGVLMPPRR